MHSSALGWLARIQIVVASTALGLLGAPLRSGAETLTSAELFVSLASFGSFSVDAVGPEGEATSDRMVTFASGLAFQGTGTTPLPTECDLCAILTTLEYALQQTTEFVKTTTTTPGGGQLTDYKRETNPLPNSKGTFTGTAPSQVGGEMLIGGQGNIYGFGESRRPFILMPLPFGADTTVTGSDFNIVIRADADPWTAGTTTITDVTTTTPSGVMNTGQDIVLTGSNDLNSKGTGTLIMHAPIKVFVKAGSTDLVVPVFARLTLVYAPEPATLLLHGAGIAGVILVAASRRRRR